MHTSVSTAPSATRAPTAQQWAVMGFLYAFYRDEDRLPTRAEISSHFNWRSANSADQHLQALVRRGLVEKRGPNLRFARTEKAMDALERLQAKEQGEQPTTTPADLETA